MIKSVLRNKRVGSHVEFLYPKHGKRNVLRSVKGRVEAKGVGPNGPYVKVDEGKTGVRTFSARKIVEI